MNSIFVTIVGQKHYYGMKPFKVGQVVKLVKEADNEIDCEAIKVVLPFVGTIGYIANSPTTVYQGTRSAGRIYDKMGVCTYARIMFVTHSSAIALIEPEACEEYKHIKEEDFEEKIVF